MSITTIILLSYILSNLLLLAFKPVRQGWREYFSVYNNFLYFWKDLVADIKNEKSLWKKSLMALLTIAASVFILLLIVVFTIIPILTYRNAIDIRNEKIEEKNSIPHPNQWGANTNQTRIVFDSDLPFTPDIDDVIYIENEYDHVVNEFIISHYDELQQRFRKKNFNFVYTPKLSNASVSSEDIHYMFPYLSNNAAIKIDNIDVESFKQHVKDGLIAGPAMIHYLDEDCDSESYRFSYRPLVPNSTVSLADQFKWYIENVSNASGEHYRVIPPQGDEIADACFNDGDVDSHNAYTYLFDDEDFNIVNEIKDRIHILRKKGYQLGMLRKLVEEKPTLSRLVVDKDFRILLPDYNNTEITMPPLPKAVFLLFIKHPEGIAFKQLSDYYPELLDIYKQVSNRVVEKNILNSIRDITDPTKNSINEKCTRIREAFLSKFDYAYAHNYYITGKRGEPKKITLPRELIELQAL